MTAAWGDGHEPAVRAGAAPGGAGAGGAAGAVATWRDGLSRGANGTGRAGAGAPPRIVHVDPRDGGEGVFRDTPVVLCASWPLEEASLNADSVLVSDPAGPVPGQVELLSGLVLVWRPARPLRAHTLHFVLACGLRDRQGRELPRHLSRFMPCAFTSRDWAAD